MVSIKVPETFTADGLCLNPAINIFRVFPGILEDVSNRIKAGLGIYRPENLLVRKRKKFRVLQTGYMVLKKCMNNVMIGDYRTEWMPFCLHFLKKLDLKSYDVLITSQEPVVGGLIGLHVKRWHPDLTWIADIGDSMLAPYYPSLRRKIDKIYERRIITFADGITVTNESEKKAIEARHPVEEGKIRVIKQGFLLEDCPELATQKNEVFTLAFTGTFYEGFRDPTNLIEALSELSIDYKFIVAARTDTFMAEFEKIKDHVSFLGLIPHSECLKIQRKADILVHLGNRQLSQVPGKFYEYLGAGKPILAIVYQDEDETAVLTKKLHVGMVCGNDKYEIKNAILTLYGYWKDDVVTRNFEVDCKKFKSYSWEAGAEKIKHLINACCEQGKEKNA